MRKKQLQLSSDSLTDAELRYLLVEISNCVQFPIPKQAAFPSYYKGFY